MYEGLINNLRKAADKWEKEHPIIGVGQLRVHDALRDAARALKEADSQLELVTLERNAAVKDLKMRSRCSVCRNSEISEAKEPCFSCLYACNVDNFEWRGTQNEE